MYVHIGPQNTYSYHHFATVAITPHPNLDKYHTIHQHEIITESQTKLLQEYLTTIHVSNEWAHIMFRSFYFPSDAFSA